MVHVQKAQVSRACRHQWRNRCSAHPHTCPSHLRWFEDDQACPSFAFLIRGLPGSASACSELISCSSPWFAVHEHSPRSFPVSGGRFPHRDLGRADTSHLQRAFPPLASPEILFTSYTLAIGLCHRLGRVNPWRS